MRYIGKKKKGEEEKEKTLFKKKEYVSYMFWVMVDLMKISHSQYLDINPSAWHTYKKKTYAINTIFTT